jgi:hypothetical protein
MLNGRATALPANQALAAAASSTARAGAIGLGNSTHHGGGAAHLGTANPVTPVASGKLQAAHSTAARSSASQAQNQFNQLPISFQANQGQFNSQVQFMAQVGSYNAFLTTSGLTIDLPAPTTGGSVNVGETTGLHQHATLAQRLAAAPQAKGPDTLIQMQVVGANLSSAASQQQLPGKVNYYIGSDPSQWHTNIATYGQVAYQAVYPGIDLVYYGHQQQLEYDFVVNPGADPRAITLGFAGVNQVALDSQGNLVLSTANGQLVQHQPYAYQDVNGVRQEIASRFVLNAQHQVTFQVGGYDASKALVIDPSLAFSTFYGGSGTDRVFGAAVDAAGDVYVAGHTSSTNLPGANNTYGGGSFDAFAAAFDPTGSTLLYATYIGGSGDDESSDMTVDPNTGVAYVTGVTNSTNLPTKNAFQTSKGSAGAVNDFLTAVNPDGSLAYSTYIGGSVDDEGGNTLPGPEVATDGQGHAFVVGYASSPDFPTTPGAYQTTQPNMTDSGFLTEIDINQSGKPSLLYSTYIHSLQNANDEQAVGVAVDANGLVYVTGFTDSHTFPVSANAYQGKNNAPTGGYNNFIAEFDLTKSGSAALVASTYLGGSMGTGGPPPVVLDSTNGLAIDAYGDVYIVGVATSSDYPVTSDAYQSGLVGSSTGAGILSVVSNDLSTLLYSTYLGGSSGVDYAAAVATYTDPNTGQAYAVVSGATASADFPTLNSILNYTGVQDAFVADFTIDTTGSGATVTNYATLLGGTNVLSAGLAAAFEPDGTVIAGGSTGATDFPTTPGAFQTVYGGSDRDGWVAHLV